MKQFVFSLQSLFDIKHTLETNQKLLLKSIEERLVRLTAILETIRKKRTAAYRDQAKVVKTGTTARELVQYSCYVERLNKLMQEQHKRIDQAELEKKACLDDLIAIRKEIKSLEKLREIELEAYNVLCKNESYKRADDHLSYKISAG